MSSQLKNEASTAPLPHTAYHHIITIPFCASENTRKEVVCLRKLVYASTHAHATRTQAEEWLPSCVTHTGRPLTRPIERHFGKFSAHKPAQATNDNWAAGFSRFALKPHPFSSVMSISGKSWIFEILSPTGYILYRRGLISVDFKPTPSVFPPEERSGGPRPRLACWQGQGRDSSSLPPRMCCSERSECRRARSWPPLRLVLKQRLCAFHLFIRNASSLLEKPSILVSHSLETLRCSLMAAARTYSGRARDRISTRATQVFARITRRL